MRNVAGPVGSGLLTATVVTAAVVVVVVVGGVVVAGVVVAGAVVVGGVVVAGALVVGTAVVAAAAEVEGAGSPSALSSPHAAITIVKAMMRVMGRITAGRLTGLRPGSSLPADTA